MWNLFVFCENAGTGARPVALSGSMPASKRRDRRLMMLHSSGRTSHAARHASNQDFIAFNAIDGIDAIHCQCFIYISYESGTATDPYAVFIGMTNLSFNINRKT